MNLSTLNSGALNGSAASLIVVAAAAAITAACSISAAATRVQDALAPTSSGAQISAAPFVTRYGDSTISGTAQAFFTPTHIKQAHASGTATATITAFVTRTVDASAFVNTTGNLLAIPASTLGESDIAGGAAVTVDATRIQPGQANAPTSAQIGFTADALVNRVVAAQIIAAVATVRVESAVNDVYDSYSDVRGSAEISIVDPGLVIRPATAPVEATAITSANATHIQPGFAQPMGVSLVVVADPFLRISPGVVITASASATATATRVPQGQALVNATCTSSAAPNMRIGSAAPVFNGTASVVANITRTQPGAVNFSPMTGGMTATAVRVLVPTTAITSSGALVNSAITLTTFGSASFSGSGAFVATPDVTVREGVANITGDAAVATAEPLVTRFVVSQPTGTAEVAADAVRLIGGLAYIDCQVTLNVRAVGNLDSEDPLERTFVKPAYTSTFTRTAQITEFRRAA
jgi:hypothetical protein